ncbi:ABC transporter permease [archaeon]|nr:ABC transporter permease [archaeon]
MISTHKKFYGYLKKDFVLLYKRKKYLYTFVLLPILISLIFLLVLNPSDYTINAGVCNLDSQKISQEIFSNLDNFETTILPIENCEENLKSDIQKGKYSLGIIVPEGFSNNLENLKQSRLIVYYDSTDVAFAELISWKLDSSLEPFEKQIVDNLNKEFTSNVASVRKGISIIKDELPSSISKNFKESEDNLKNLEEMGTEFLVNPIWTDKRSVSEKDLQKDAGLVFVFPILALLITLMLASTSLIYDKKTNFLIRVKSSTSPAIFILAKLLFFTILVFVQFGIITSLFMLYGARYPINLLNIFELVLSIAMIDTLLGFIIGLLSENEGIAVLFSLIISFPLMLISGIFFPIQTLPTFVQWISKILPLNYQITSAKVVLLFNQNISNLWMIYVVVLFGLTWYLIRKK